MITTTEQPLPVPLAEDATTATSPAGPCSLCKRAIMARERYAALVPSGRLAHLHCIGRLIRVRRRTVPQVW